MPRSPKYRQGSTSRKAGPKRDSSSSNVPWTDDELRRSVDVYVLLLRFQRQGADQKAEPLAQALLSGPLALRNNTAIRYRMRNISAVVKDLGAPTLFDFSAAESVGSGVRPRIRAMLLDNQGFTRLLSPSNRSPDEDWQDALIALEALRECISDLEQELSWVGHNNPPDTPAFWGIELNQFQQALSDVNTIRSELESANPDTIRVEQSKSRIFRFAVLLVTWVGERATKFTDAALIAAAPIFIVKLSGLMPAVINAMEAVTKTLGP